VNHDAYGADLAALPRGSAAAGEIELLTPEEARAAGIEEPGVVYQDRWIVLFRDAVRFPSGRTGTYLRLCVEPLATGGGVVVVPRRDGRYVLLRNFRHATRRWEWAFPRGFAGADLPIEASARREVREELGSEVEVLAFLGRVPADSGLIASEFHVFEAALGEAGARAPEASEAIDPSGVQELDRGAFLAAIADGRIVDGITLAAFALSLARDPG